RRFSYENPDNVVSVLNNYRSTFVGPSNVYLAMKYDTTPIGTHAYEWFMFHAAMFGYKYANRASLENWVKIYRGNLGIALSDTFTTPVFFRDFDTLFAKLFDGVRHDSGDPLEFADKTIAHYQSLRINPLSKTIVFSDALNPQMVERIHDYCKDKIGMSFGIGTNFTNDVGVRPLNMVIKLSHVLTDNRWTQVVKLSDTPGKHTGNDEVVGRIMAELGI
ncbi:MAG: nicotinate phosphoribosyltransferase, partial [Bacteroidales bacterium]|nr:nicotinate phosphoribosyltransferase [Bacteroidales bacterium]